jgi:dipeptidyl aminopeptidase/acylaminoacyl peptidase
MPADNQPKYTTELSVSLRLPSDVQLAPNGQRVAFVVAPIAHAEPKPTSEIWLAGVGADANPRRFTTADAEERSPRWSPDGTRLAFLSDRAERGAAQLHLIDAAGGEATALAPVRRGIDQIEWRPDGQALSGTADRLALAGQQDPPGDIYVASLADRPRVIVQLPVDGSEPSVLGPAEGHVWIYAWSRDGRSIAAVTTGSNRLDDRIGDVRCAIIDVTTRAERTLATLPFVPDLLQWSPDGTQLVAINETGETPDDTRVILFDSQSGASRTLEPGDTTPAWAGWVGDGSK